MILVVAGCWIAGWASLGLADPISECMETGHGTPMEGRWNLVSEQERFRLCRDQETDRQKADRVMREWQEEQRRLREKATGKTTPETTGSPAQTEAGAKPEGSPVPQARGTELAPCSRPDGVGECEATPDQILYQIRRSKELEGERKK